MCAHMQAGDVLFIPEGFWHQVDSSAGAIAVNFWFESQTSCRVLDPSLSHFYLTRLLQDAVVRKKEQMLEAIPEHGAFSEGGTSSDKEASEDSLTGGLLLERAHCQKGNSVDYDIQTHQGAAEFKSLLICAYNCALRYRLPNFPAECKQLFLCIRNFSEVFCGHGSLLHLL